MGSEGNSPPVQQDARASDSSEPLLVVDELSIDYVTERGHVKAVDRLSFELRRGEVLGLAGESGSGKSTAAMGILRLLPPPAVITGGRVLFRGKDVFSFSEPELSAFRWSKISVVFQSAMNALNPVLTVGAQISDVIRQHERITKQEARSRALDLLRLVGIEASRLDSYPHELSGGMRQRVVIAIALCLRPEVLFMDEPTTALDVVLQKEILQQIADLREQLGFSVLFITHDLSLMLEFCDRIGVLYAGRLAEVAPARALFERPQHPYTKGLMNSFPEIGGRKERRTGIGGAPPSMLAPPAGCRFHPRCPQAQGACSAETPVLRELGPRHLAACLFAEPYVGRRQPSSAESERDDGEPDFSDVSDESDRPTAPELPATTQQHAASDEKTVAPPRAEQAPDPREAETRFPPGVDEPGAPESDS